MLAQVRNLTACVIGVVLFVVSAGHAFDETALAKAKEAARIGAVFVCESCALQGETGWRGPPKANLLNAKLKGVALDTARLCKTVLPDGLIANNGS